MTDEQLVLQYCAGKGYPPHGLTAVEALKAQLKAENGGKDHPRVDIAQHVYLATIQFANLRIPASQHWERIQSAPLTPPNQGEKPIAGVVIENRDGTYTLVDGYHRTKGLKTESQATQADYFVLR